MNPFSSEVIARLKGSPEEHPFPGITVVTLKDRPLIKALAILTQCWDQLKGDVASIKALSLEKDASRVVCCALYDLTDLTEPVMRSSWYIVEAAALEGSLETVTGVMVLAEPGTHQLGHDFAHGIINSMFIKAKEDQGIEIITERDEL
jgi:hypothetical protein